MDIQEKLKRAKELESELNHLSDEFKIKADELSLEYTKKICKIRDEMRKLS